MYFDKIFDSSFPNIAAFSDNKVHSLAFVLKTVRYSYQENSCETNGVMLHFDGLELSTKNSQK